MFFVNISIISKVFRDFSKIKSMNKGLIIGIAIAIVAGIIAITIISNENSDGIEVEDTLDREIIP